MYTLSGSISGLAQSEWPCEACTCETDAEITCRPILASGCIPCPSTADNRDDVKLNKVKMSKIDKLHGKQLSAAKGLPSNQ